MTTVDSALGAEGETGDQHPVVAETLAKRSQDAQLRIADAITRLAGSMAFVYIHVAVFAVWMLWVERNPWPTLTLVVSLEAIFLSTFVMIGQNRQADFQQRKADYEFNAQERHLEHNTVLTEKVHTILVELDRRLPVADAGEPPGGSAEDAGHEPPSAR
jgi:uncharacterized membrane protein